MVQVRGVTYRIERLKPHHYAVVRLLDDAPMGRFQTLPGLRLDPHGCDAELFAEMAKAALRFARTSGMLPSVSPPQRAEPAYTPASVVAGALPPDPALV